MKGLKYMAILALLAFLLAAPAQALAETVYVSDEAGLRMIAANVNAGSDDYQGDIICLSSDIALSGDWTPIGSISRGFKGTFDGRGCEISGLCINAASDDYQGLFGYVDSGGVVKNLTVSGGVHGKEEVGGIAGYNAGRIENSVNKAVISGDRNVGGVVGRAGSNGTIKNCVNEGAVARPGANADNNRAVGGTDCWWLKNDAISPDHAFGGQDARDSGCTSADADAALPAAAIILDRYYFEGGSFDVAATAYPMGSSQASGGLKLTPTTITLTPATLSNGVKTTVTATDGTAGASYDVRVTLATTPASNDLGASVDFTVMRMAAPTPPTNVIVVSTDTTVDDYTVSADWTVQITGATVTVNGELVLEDGGVVEVQDGGAVIFGPESTVTGDGSIVLEDGGKITNNSKNDIVITAGGKPVTVKPGETYPPVQPAPSGSSGGCNAGFAGLLLLAAVPMIIRGKK